MRATRRVAAARVINAIIAGGLPAIDAAVGDFRSNDGKSGAARQLRLVVGHVVRSVGDDLVAADRTHDFGELGRILHSHDLRFATGARLGQCSE